MRLNRDITDPALLQVMGACKKIHLPDLFKRFQRRNCVRVAAFDKVCEELETADRNQKQRLILRIVQSLYICIYIYIPLVYNDFPYANSILIGYNQIYLVVLNIFDIRSCDCGDDCG